MVWCYNSLCYNYLGNNYHYNYYGNNPNDDCIIKHKIKAITINICITQQECRSNNSTVSYSESIMAKLIVMPRVSVSYSMSITAIIPMISAAYSMSIIAIILMLYDTDIDGFTHDTDIIGINICIIQHVYHSNQWSVSLSVSWVSAIIGSVCSFREGIS